MDRAAGWTGALCGGFLPEVPFPDHASHPNAFLTGYIAQSGYASIVMNILTIILCIFFWVPGIIHAFWVCSSKG